MRDILKMPLNKKIRKTEIEHKLVEIDNYLDQIQETLPKNEESFIESGIKKHGIYKLIELAIENIIKICSMINSDLKLGVPSDEENIIINLVKKNILTKELAEKIKNMKGFRNILVHRYGEISDELAFEVINSDIEDFERFKKEISDFLDKK